MRNLTKNLLFGTLLGVLLVVPAMPSFAGLLFEDTMGEQSFANVRGGEMVRIGSSMGWISQTQKDPQDEGFRGSDALTYALADMDLYPLPQQGTFVLDLFYYRKGGKEYGTPNATYSTVMDFLNPDNTSAFALYSVWEGYFGKGESVLSFSGSPDPRSVNVYGMWVPVGKRVQVGDAVRLALTWGPDPESDNKVFINGRKAGIAYRNIQNRTPAVPSQNLLDLIKDADRIRIGVASGTGKNFPDGDGPMYNTAVDRMAVYDEILTEADLRPEIRSFSHDAFTVAGYSGKLVAGDTITVTMAAESGGEAYFDVGPVMGLAMLEDPDRAGIYVGNYKVSSGQDLEDGQVVGHFTSRTGPEAYPVTASRNVTIDTRTYMTVKTSNNLIPADRSARSGITVLAEDANGKAVQGRELKLTLSTTDEYTGIVGSGQFEDLVGSTVDVDWGGVTDSFGEVTAQYISGFAAKTILVSAKDMSTGDVGTGFVRSFIDGTVDIVVKRPAATALSVSGSMVVSLSRDWLTADGKSRSRLTAVLQDASGEPLSGHSVRFELLGGNGTIKIVQGKTDSRGRATADYIAGTIMGQVQIEVRDVTSGMVTLVSIELRPDAPSEIILVAAPVEVVTDGLSNVSATVTDANGNPNAAVDVLFKVASGPGAVSSPSVGTNEEGVASVIFEAGSEPGLATVKGTVISREPTEEELSAAEGAVFLYGLEEDPGRLDVVEWLVEPGDEVVEEQALVTLEDGTDVQYTVVAPRDGTVSTFMAEERDRVEYGDTLGYILELAE
jgi:biotin carboxyl carrier protein